MDRLIDTWRLLDNRRRAMLVGAVVASFFAILMLVQVTSKPSMALLYSGLDAATAGEVLGALETMNVVSEVKGDAIFVAENERDRVRLALARDGLPRQGQAGYELLDQISGFSSTTDMFNAAYWRAKEGELARTILASPGVRAARVHIAAPSRRPFSAGTAKPTASVTVTMTGGTLTQTQATAIRYLVALAVADLPPDQVGVIDSRAGVILAPGSESGLADAAGEAADREAKLKADIEQLLAARVGRDKARVSVTVETDREAESSTEKVLEPSSRVTIHSETEEIADSSKGGGGNVTVASNLPAGDAGGAGNQQSSNRSENRENVNYDYSEVTRVKTRGAGAIKKISVAVLVDGITTIDANGVSTWAPRSADEIAQLTQLVSAAVGFDEKRGDVVTIESLAFQADATPGEFIEAGFFMRLLERNAMTLIQIAVLSIIVLILALTVLRPLLTRRRETEAEAAAAAGLLAGPEADIAAEAAALVAGAEGVLVGPDGVIRLEGPNDAENLRRRIAERPEQALAMLKDWLDPAAVVEEAA